MQVHGMEQRELRRELPCSTRGDGTVPLKTGGFVGEAQISGELDLENSGVWFKAVETQ